MLRATLFIMACTAKNRVRRRINRLREPRYLGGALVGAAYFYFALFGRRYFNRYADNGERRRPAPASFLPLLGAAGPVLAGVGLMLAAAASWLMPFGSGLLEFSTAETEFLFAAPVSRRQLLFYRVVRSQWGTLFGSVIVALTYPSATMAARGRGLIGAWLVLMTCHVFFTGVALTRVGVTTTKGRLLSSLPRLLVWLALAGVAVPVAAAVARQPVNDALDAFRVVADVAGRGAVQVILLPFVAVVRPLFSDTWRTFALAMIPALAVYGVLLLWILQSDEAFGRLSDELVEAKASMPARRTIAYKARDVGWTLARSGWGETPFVWKAMVQSRRIVDTRVLYRLVAIVGWLVVVALVASRARGFAQVIGFFTAAASGFTVLMGPQILRTDLRQDLQHLDVLKTWPVDAGVIVRGEMIWPALATTSVGWGFAGIALLLSASAFPEIELPVRISVGIAGMILMPAVVLLQYVIHNTVALLFPAWVPTGRGRSRGVEAMGQRTIPLGLTIVVLILGVTPAALAAGVLGWLAYAAAGIWIAVPCAAVAAAVIGVEVWMATEALGPAYERLDISSVEREQN